MPTPRRVTPWHTFSIVKGNTTQIGGLLSAVALAWYAGQAEGFEARAGWS